VCVGALLIQVIHGAVRAGHGLGGRGSNVLLGRRCRRWGSWSVWPWAPAGRRSGQDGHGHGCSCSNDDALQGGSPSRRVSPAREGSARDSRPVDPLTSPTRAGSAERGPATLSYRCSHRAGREDRSPARGRASGVGALAGLTNHPFERGCAAGADVPLTPRRTRHQRAATVHHKGHYGVV